MEFNLKGTIYDNDFAECMRYYGWTDNCCPADLEAAIQGMGEDDNELVININSGGGDLVAGMEIFSLLRAQKCNTTAIVQGISASAATVAMQGCKRIKAEPVATMCIHDPTMVTEGNEGDFRRSIADLKAFKESIINAYMLHNTQKSRKEFADLMSKDIMITAQKALEYGIIDEIIDGDKLGDSGLDNLTGIVYNACNNIVMPTQKMIDDYHSFKAERDKAAAMADVEKQRTIALFNVLSK